MDTVTIATINVLQIIVVIFILYFVVYRRIKKKWDTQDKP
jgi:Na+/glutamate symporter